MNKTSVGVLITLPVLVCAGIVSYGAYVNRAWTEALIFGVVAGAALLVAVAMIARQSKQREAEAAAAASHMTVERVKKLRAAYAGWFAAHLLCQACIIALGLANGFGRGDISLLSAFWLLIYCSFVTHLLQAARLLGYGYLGRLAVGIACLLPLLNLVTIVGIEIGMYRIQKQLAAGDQT